MGVIEKIQDYFVKNSQEYKAFINEMKKSSPEEFYMDGEREYSKNEQKFLRLFEKDQGKKNRTHSESADFQIKNKQDIIINEIEKIKVIPATKEQIEESFIDRMASIDIKAYVDLFSEKQLNSIPDVIENNNLDKGDKIQLLLNNYPDLYENGINFTYVIDENSYLKKHIIKDDYNPEVINMLEFVSKENVFFENKNIQLDEKQKVEITPATAEQKLQYSQHMEGIEFTDMPIVDFPKFTEAQLNSVPDIINGIPVTDYEKKMILLDSFEFSVSNNWSSTFSIDENNKLIEKYHDIDHNNEVFEIKKHILKEDVMYVNQNDLELTKGKEETLSDNPLENEQLENLAQKMNNYYDQIGETMWNFNHKEGKDILEFAMYLKEFPETVSNMVLDYLNVEVPLKPDWKDYDDSHRGDDLYDAALDNYNSKELPEYNYTIKNFESYFSIKGLDITKIPENLFEKANYLNILLNDVTKILGENNKELKNETVKLEPSKHVQLSTESNLSIDNIYGFTPTDQQKKDLENGKGITGEIQGKNYFIQLSAQEKNKGSLQILSIEKAKEFNLLTEASHNQKNIKQTGLRA
jgi:hypothetical protein